uniref:Uncharacterized protein n=1 Tax=Fagus sylvatica TaxID=28930 RepID=A0A2N9IWX7_FAGSY
MARMSLFWDVASTVYKGIQSYIHYKEIERKRKIAVLKYEESKLKREASKLQLEAKLRRELLQRLSMEEKSGSLSHSEMIRQQRIEARMERLQLHQQAKLGLCIQSYIHYKEIERKRKIAVLKYEESKLKREASKLQLEAKLRRELLQRLSMEEKSGSLSHSEMIRQQRIEARMERLQLHQQAKLGLCIQSYIHYKEIERKRKIAVLKYEESKLKREASKLQLEAKLRRELLQRLSMEEKSGSLSHSEMIRQQRIEARMERLQLHQQAKLGLCIQSYIHYKEIERKRKIAVLKYEESKLKREASKLQLEAKLRRELLQRLSMEEKSGSLSHSEMIRQQRIEARMERLQLHQQAKLGLYDAVSAYNEANGDPDIAVFVRELWFGFGFEFGHGLEFGLEHFGLGLEFGLEHFGLVGGDGVVVVVVVVRFVESDQI